MCSMCVNALGKAKRKFGNDDDDDDDEFTHFSLHIRIVIGSTRTYIHTRHTYHRKKERKKNKCCMVSVSIKCHYNSKIIKMRNPFEIGHVKEWNPVQCFSRSLALFWHGHRTWHFNRVIQTHKYAYMYTMSVCTVTIWSRKRCFANDSINLIWNLRNFARTLLLAIHVDKHPISVHLSILLALLPYNRANGQNTYIQPLSLSLLSSRTRTFTTIRKVTTYKIRFETLIVINLTISSTLHAILFSCLFSL